MRATIESGSSISHYRVLSALGSGGMGEVYVARDLTLERTVALKILPPQLTRSEERLRRFVLEAKSASSLSHPHIVTIHEIGQGDVTSDDGSTDEAKSDPIHFIAMELIDGMTLRAKIHDEKVDLKTLLVYLTQAAEGLAKAHAAGIIHRDLKPDNIMVTKDGYAKILDFGLAKLQIKGTSADVPNEGPTQVRDETREGAVLGTVGYMAPEQVQGKQADHRADIFAFGCLLYEAATRQRPFRADSDVDVMHKILHDKPEPIDTINPEAPAELRRLIRRCLAKDPEKRYQSMKDLALELGDLVNEYEDLSHSGDSRTSTASGTSNPAIAVASRRNRLVLIASGAAALVVVVVALALLLRGKGAKTEAAPVNSFASMKITRVTTSGNIDFAAISADNRYLANVVNDRGKSALFVRQIATGSTVPVVPAGNLAIRGVTFSPDGNYLYYIQAESEQSGYAVVYQVPSLGGTPRKITFDVDTPISFAPDGKRFAFVRGFPQLKESAVVIADVDGGAERKIAIRKSPANFPLLHAAWSPDGKGIAVVGVNGTDPRIVIVDVASGKEQPVGQTSWSFISGLEWLPDGSGLVVTAAEKQIQNQVWLLSYPSGDVRRITNDLNDYTSASVTADGKTLATIQASGYSNLWSMIPGENGSEKQLTTGQQEEIAATSVLPDGSVLCHSLLNGQVGIVRISPTGERVQLTSGSTVARGPSADREGRTILFSLFSGGVPHIAKMNREGSDIAQLTNGKAESSAQISPDGNWFLYRAHDGTIWRMATAGGQPVKIAEQSTSRPGISPDGTKILLSPILQRGDRAKRYLVVIPSGGGAPIVEFERDGRLFNTFSPKADAIDYVMSTDGVENIWRQPMDGSAPRQITNFKSGIIGSFVWQPDGKTLVLSREQAVNDVVLISEFR